MNASSLPHTIAARVCASAAVAAAIIIGASCGSKSPTTPPVTTTTVPTTTSTTTTTSIPGLSGTIAVQNTPCVAPGSGPVSCTFAASATGGQAPYTFAWRFTNPANNAVVNANGPQATPELGCGVSAGVVTFNLAIVLTVTPASGAPITVNSTQPIARQAGACGT